MIAVNYAAILLIVLVSTTAAPAKADHCVLEGSYAVATFNNVYTGNWMTGQPYDYVTIAPNGAGETFADNGIEIKVCLVCDGQPLVAVPRTEIVLFHPNLCICPWGNLADADTDENGCTTFTGTIAGGGSATSLDVYANGIYIGTVPVKINSTDTGIASPCFSDSSDLGAFAAVFGNPAAYDIAFDYNETGPPTIDASDLAYLAGVLGAQCTTVLSGFPDRE